MNNLPLASGFSDYVIENLMDANQRRLLAPNYIPNHLLMAFRSTKSVLADKEPRLAHNILTQQTTLERIRIERNAQVSMFNNGVLNLSNAATELARDPTTRGVEFYRYRRRTKHLFRPDEEIEVVGVRKV